MTNLADWMCFELLWKIRIVFEWSDYCLFFHFGINRDILKMASPCRFLGHCLILDKRKEFELESDESSGPKRPSLIHLTECSSSSALSLIFSQLQSSRRKYPRIFAISNSHHFLTLLTFRCYWWSTTSQDCRIKPVTTYRQL